MSSQAERQVYTFDHKIPFGGDVGAELAMTMYATDPDPVSAMTPDNLAVFAPGFGQNRACSLLRIFGVGLASQGYVAVTFDAPGTYDSAFGQPYSLFQTVDAIHAIVGHITPVNRLALGGYSVGGFLGAYAATGLAERMLPPATSIVAVHTPASREDFGMATSFRRAVDRGYIPHPQRDAQGAIRTIVRIPISNSSPEEYASMGSMSDIFKRLDSQDNPPHTLWVANKQDEVAPYPPIAEICEHHSFVSLHTPEREVGHDPYVLHEIGHLLAPVLAHLAPPKPGDADEPRPAGSFSFL